MHVCLCVTYGGCDGMKLAAIFMCWRIESSVFSGREGGSLDVQYTYAGPYICIFLCPSLPSFPHHWISLQEHVAYANNCVWWA